MPWEKGDDQKTRLKKVRAKAVADRRADEYTRAAAAQKQQSEQSGGSKPGKGGKSRRGKKSKKSDKEPVRPTDNERPTPPPPPPPRDTPSGLVPTALPRTPTDRRSGQQKVEEPVFPMWRVISGGSNMKVRVCSGAPAPTTSSLFLQTHTDLLSRASPPSF